MVIGGFFFPNLVAPETGPDRHRPVRRQINVVAAPDMLANRVGRLVASFIPCRAFTDGFCNRYISIRLAFVHRGLHDVNTKHE